MENTQIPVLKLDHTTGIQTSIHMLNQITDLVIEKVSRVEKYMCNEIVDSKFIYKEEVKNSRLVGIYDHAPEENSEFHKEIRNHSIIKNRSLALLELRNVSRMGNDIKELSLALETLKSKLEKYTNDTIEIREV